jgi:preprotein translocase subunit SecY
MRLNGIKPAAGAKHARTASAAASARAGARPPAAATRARSRAPAASTRSVSRAARCRCSAACRSAASRSLTRDDVAEVRLARWKARGADDRLRAEGAAGIVPRRLWRRSHPLRASSRRRFPSRGSRRDQGRARCDRGAGGSVEPRPEPRFRHRTRANVALANEKSQQPVGRRQVRRPEARLLFLLGALIVYRIGAHMPVPGIDPEQLAELFNQQQGGILDMFNMFSGGALSRFSIFALGIMPYISASIIMQLMTVVSPHARGAEEGRRGRAAQDHAVHALRHAGPRALPGPRHLDRARVAAGLVIDPGLMFRSRRSSRWSPGTMFLMWLGEQITERGIGNGISLIIFAGIAAGLPARSAARWSSCAPAFSMPRSWRCSSLPGDRRDRASCVRRARPAQDPGQLREAPGRQQGLRRAELAPAVQAEHGRRDPADLRLVDHPVPGDARGLVRRERGHHVAARPRGDARPGSRSTCCCTRARSSSSASSTPRCVQPEGDGRQPEEERAPSCRASGPATRPRGTSKDHHAADAGRRDLRHAGVPAARVPDPAWNVPFYFGGTSLLIIVVVTMDFMAQVQAYMMTHQYESLLKKANFKGGRSPCAKGRAMAKEETIRCRAKSSRPPQRDLPGEAGERARHVLGHISGKMRMHYIRILPGRQGDGRADALRPDARADRVPGQVAEERAGTRREDHEEYRLRSRRSAASARSSGATAWCA